MVGIDALRIAGVREELVGERDERQRPLQHHLDYLVVRDQQVRDVGEVLDARAREARVAVEGRGHDEAVRREQREHL